MHRGLNTRMSYRTYSLLLLLIIKYIQYQIFIYFYMTILKLGLLQSTILSGLCTFSTTAIEEKAMTKSSQEMAPKRLSDKERRDFYLFIFKSETSTFGLFCPLVAKEVIWSKPYYKRKAVHQRDTLSFRILG